MSPRLGGFELRCHPDEYVFAPGGGHELHAHRQAMRTRAGRERQAGESAARREGADGVGIGERLGVSRTVVREALMQLQAAKKN